MGHSHSLWQQKFSRRLKIYRPSPLEQARVKRMVHNTLATRTIRNKVDLLDIIKKDKEDSVWTIGEMATSRLRYELLAASAARVHDQYMNELDSDWSVWYEWQKKKAEWYHRSGSIESDTDSSTTGFGSGITKAKAEASGSFEASGATGLKLDKSGKKGGWRHALKGNLHGAASGSGEGSAEARMADLMGSADAGLEAEANLRADIDYELKYSCKVKGEYLRRLLGSDMDVAKVKASGKTEVHAKGSGSANASASLFRLQTGVEGEKKLKEGAEAESETDGPGIRGIKSSLEGEVSLAVVMRGNASVSVGQAAEVELGGNLFAGGRASGELQCFVNGQGVGLDMGAKLFAGFEVGFDQKVSLKHPRRGVNIFSLKARETASVGVGVAAKLTAKATADEVSFDTEAGATLGFGASLKTNGLVSPRGIMLVGYDAIAMPSIYALAKTMQSYAPGSVHTDRLASFSEYLNRKASYAELSQVYLDCRGRMVSLIGNLDEEADHVQKRAARNPGFDGYGKVMGIEDINAVDGFVDNSQSKYFAYATEEIRKADGTLIQSVTSQGDRKASVVADDKKALWRAAHDYAGQKQILRSGECIAFDVIKGDIKAGRVTV